MNSQSIDWSYQMPTRVVFGEGSLAQIGAFAAEFGAKKAFIITGKKAMRRYGVIERLLELLKPINAETFEDVEPNPTLETFEKAYETFRKRGCDIVIGLGGGSSLDVAKVVASIGGGERSLAELFTPPTKIARRDFPMIAIPSTSGTGSEVTPFSIVTDTKNETKKAANHLYLYPNIALIDPVICKTMPKDVTAHTGLDAISHAIEAFWAKKAQPISNALALDSLKRMLLSLRKAYDEPENIEARSEMALGSLEAGMAFSNTMTAAVHSISYPLTAKFNIPHGLACALTLPSFIKFNAPSILDKVDLLLSTMGVRSIEEASQSIIRLMEDLGQPIKLSELGLGCDDIPWIVKHGFSPARMANNPREVTEKDVEEILEEIM